MILPGSTLEIVFRELGHKAIQLAAVYLMLDTLVAMARAFVKLGVGERKG